MEIEVLQEFAQVVDDFLDVDYQKLYVDYLLNETNKRYLFYPRPNSEFVFKCKWSDLIAKDTVYLILAGNSNVAVETNLYVLAKPINGLSDDYDILAIIPEHNKQLLVYHALDYDQQFDFTFKKME